MIKEQKEKIKSIEIRNCIFAIVNIAMVLILLSSILFEVLKFKYNYFNFQEYKNITNSLGIASQIITAVVTCILSIIGISFSLQSNEYFHIKVRDINAMRVVKHYSYLFIFIVNILLLFGNICFYSLGMYILCIGIGLTSIIFCVTILIQEIQILTQNQKAYLNIFKYRFIIAAKSKNGDSFKSNDYLRNEFDAAIEDLIKQKNLITVYEYFKIDNKPNYNKKVLLKLLDIQQHLAFKLKYIKDQKELIEICDNLKSNILNIAWGDLNIKSILGDNYQDYQHYLTRVIYQLINTTEQIAIEISDALMDVIFYKNFDDKDGFEKFFWLSIVIAVITSTTTHNNLSFLNSIKKKYTSNYFLISSNSSSTLLFATISVYLYYLLEKQNEISTDLKDKINSFINDSYFLDNFQYLSWKKLFANFIDNFSLNYKDFIYLCINNQYYLSHVNFTPFAKSVVFTSEFITDWYLAILFNSEKIYDFDFEKEFYCLSEGKYNYYLENFVNKNFKNSEFKPTQELQKMAEFYLDNYATFNYVKSTLQQKNNFLSYHNKLKEKDLEAKAEISSKIKNEDIVNKYKPIICNALRSDYGFDSNINLSNVKEKFISIMFERTSEAINYDECLTSTFINSIFYDIGKSINFQTIKIDKNFDSNLSKILQKKLEKYVGSINLCEFYIGSSSLKSNFTDRIRTLEKVNSKILKQPIFILKNGYGYNILIKEFSVKDLTEAQLNTEVDKYKRADGQYVYEGLFLSREKVEKLIRDRYVVITIIFKYKVQTYPGALIKIDLFPKE